MGRHTRDCIMCASVSSRMASRKEGCKRCLKTVVTAFAAEDCKAIGRKSCGRFVAFCGLGRK